MVVAKTIRTPTAIVTRVTKDSLSLPDFAWSVVLIFIGWSPVAGMVHPN
jgi:hypothetical protein